MESSIRNGVEDEAEGERIGPESFVNHLTDGE